MNEWTELDLVPGLRTVTATQLAQVLQKFILHVKHTVWKGGSLRKGAGAWGVGEPQRRLSDRVHCVSGLHTRGLCLILTLLQEAGISVLQMKPLELREGTSDVKGHTASGCQRQD